MCGYFRTAIYLVFEGQKLLPKNEDDALVFVDVNDEFKDMKILFKEQFELHLIDMKTLKKNISRFKVTNQKWGRDNCDAKDEYYDTFSPTNWNKVDDLKKSKHTLFCNECSKFFCELQAKFPSTTNKFSHARMENPSNVVNTVKNKLKKGEKTALKDSIGKTCEDLNKSYEKTFGTSFDESFQLHNSLGKKQSREEKKQLKIQHYKEAVDKINIENEFNSVDRLYGSRSSQRKWDTERKKQSFETVPEAISRSLANKKKVENGLKTLKNHVGPFSSYQVDTSLLIDIAGSWTETTDVNWKQFGEQCIRGPNNKIPANCGQIVKIYLEDQEINEGFQYTFKGKNETKANRVRRKKKRLISWVSFPVEPSPDTVKQFMEDKIRAGEIDIGESIVERKYTKKKFDKSTGQLGDHVFSVFGRKHPLLKIRVKLFNKCKKFMRLNPDSYFENISKEELTKRLLSIGEFIHETESLSDMKERLKQYERTRHLQIWHDGSCIANHGHILFCINVLYDPAVFYTSAEYTILANKDTNVQREVEAPELYIIGRCGSNDEQLAYINTRVDDLNGTKIGLKLCEIEEKYENIVLRDIMRFFMGMALLQP